MELNARKITNILNNKSLIVNVGGESDYPSFNNSVVSLRIANELNINILEYDTQYAIVGIIPQCTYVDHVPYLTPFPPHPSTFL